MTLLVHAEADGVNDRLSIGEAPGGRGARSGPT